MSKHTPGPWVVTDGCPNYVNIHSVPEEKAICDINIYPEYTTEEELSANVSLIAAAPDLLEALELSEKRISEYLEDNGDCYHDEGVCVCGLHESLQKIQAAINKSTGGVK